MGPTSCTLWSLWLIVSGCFIAYGACERRRAVCDVEPNSAEDSLTDDVRGSVVFTQEDASSDVVVTVTLRGFNTADANTRHGFHVHTNGNITGGCGAAGGHYNPDSTMHGAQTADMANRHAGDLGNVQEDASGNVDTTITDSYISLQGQYNVINRAIVVHLREDSLDESIDSSGGAGTRIACCVITETAVDAASTQHASLMTSSVAGVLTLLVVKLWL